MHHKLPKLAIQINLSTSFQWNTYSKWPIDSYANIAYLTGCEIPKANVEYLPHNVQSSKPAKKTHKNIIILAMQTKLWHMCNFSFIPNVKTHSHAKHVYLSGRAMPRANVQALIAQCAIAQSSKTHSLGRRWKKFLCIF